MDTTTQTAGRAIPWNKGKLLGQKPPLKLKEIWAIRIRLQLDHRARELALFNLAIDSKLRGCDLVGLRVHDVVQGSHVAARANVMQKKTRRPVQFEITEQTRDAVAAWITAARLKPEQFLFPSRVSASPHLSTRQYSRIVGTWVGSIGLDQAAYGTRPAGRCARNPINSSRPNRRFTISPVWASTQYIWNTRFATSNPYVVAFISGPPFLKWSSRNSTLAHRCRSVLEGPFFVAQPFIPGGRAVSIPSRSIAAIRERRRAVSHATAFETDLAQAGYNARCA
jgi:hypothetical protein